MKNKILTFIIGVLVGAIIASIGFYAYSKSHTKEFTPGERPSMSDQNENGGGTPPDMPNGGKGGGSRGSKDGNSASEKSSDDNTNTTSQDSENTI